MALRGKHAQRIMAEYGLVPVVGVHAKENPEGKAGRQKRTYVPKTADLEDIEVTMPDGSTRMVTIAACDGAASVKELTETGDPHYEPLQRVRVHCNPNKHSFRWYGDYLLPEDYGGQEIRLRYLQNEEDDRHRVNRPENLRPIPEGSEDYARLHPLRPDAESINRGVEDTLYDKRASANGWRRQMVDLLGHARLVNAITLARCRARELLATVA